MTMLISPAGHHFSPEAAHLMSAAPPAYGSPHGSPQGNGRRRSKDDVCQAFLQNLRARGTLDLDDFQFVEVGPAFAKAARARPSWPKRLARLAGSSGRGCEWAGRP